MATNKKDDTTQPSRSRRAPEKSARKSASRSDAKRGTAAQRPAQPKAMARSRSATKSQAAPAKSRSSGGSRTAGRSASPSRSQGSMLNPVEWLATLETTITSPQGRAVIAEAFRAIANVLDKPQVGGHEKGSETQQGRDAASAAGSLGAEIVAAPLESQRLPSEPPVRS
jgi:hypothetical protein